MALTFEKLRTANIERCENGYPNFKGVKDFPMEVWTLAVVGEAGELAQSVKRMLTGERLIPSVEVRDEIADIVIYCDILASCLNERLEDLVASKWNRTSEKIGWREEIL